MPPREHGTEALAFAVIVAAGKGERFGSPDKVFLPVGGRPLIAHVLDAVEQARSIDGAILVVGDHTRGTAIDLVAKGGWPKVRSVASGGARRQDSVAAGLGEVPPSTEIVVIHDGARPLAAPALFDACVESALRNGAAIAAAPVTDTLKRISGNHIVETIPRAHLWAAQTPQAFRADLLKQAIETATHEGLDVTDEASIFEAMGLPVAIVPSTAANIKVTHQDDLWIAEALFAHRPGSLPEFEP